MTTAAIEVAGTRPTVAILPASTPIVWTIQELARGHLGGSASYYHGRCDRHTLPYLTIGSLYRVAAGDEQVLPRWGLDTGEQRPRPHIEVGAGLSTLATAFAGHDRIRPTDLAGALKVSERSILRLLRAGTLPGEKFGPAWLLDVPAIRAWLIAQRVPARWEVQR